MDIYTYNYDFIKSITYDEYYKVKIKKVFYDTLGSLTVSKI